ncbi:hypothetical protein [Streptomyces avermitilis]|uniref:hypothetical protein n=1 Tax=Streptomyces avermitilis TaxID=33903 RepID=UPI0033B057FA
MPKALPVSAIRSMPYSDLERWWEVDFNTLTTTAVAEATGSVQPSVADALRSDDWIEQWADALYAASAELLSSTERMEYTQDERLKSTKRRSGLVTLRMQEANRLLRDRSKSQGWNMLASTNKNAYSASLAILGRHHAEEQRQLAEAEIARRGLAPHHPFWHTHYATKFDSIEDAVRHGLVHAPLTHQAKALLDMPVEDLTQRAAADVTRQEDRCEELRHPLLLRPWAEALERLRDEHCALNGMDPAFAVVLPGFDMRQLQSMNSDEAWKIINRRRFIRALAQRNRECQMHVRELTRAVAARLEEVKKPWMEAVAAASEELARKHPEQMKALLSAFQPFCIPGSVEIQREFLGGRGLVPRELIPELKKALADGTWQRLLDNPAE